MATAGVDGTGSSVTLNVHSSSAPGDASAATCLPAASGRSGSYTMARGWRIATAVTSVPSTRSALFAWAPERQRAATDVDPSEIAPARGKRSMTAAGSCAAASAIGGANVFPSVMRWLLPRSVPEGLKASTRTASQLRHSIEAAMRYGDENDNALKQRESPRTNS